MIFSTGAIAASCLCSYAMKSDRMYVWTRCDYIVVKYTYVKFAMQILYVCNPLCYWIAIVTNINYS